MVSSPPDLLSDWPVIHLYGVSCGVTRHGVTQLLELEQEGGGQEVGPDGHGLAELDEAGPEPGQHLPQLHRVLSLQTFVIPDLSPEMFKFFIRFLFNVASFSFGNYICTL